MSKLGSQLPMVGAEAMKRLSFSLTTSIFTWGERVIWINDVGWLIDSDGLGYRVSLRPSSSREAYHVVRSNSSSKDKGVAKQIKNTYLISQLISWVLPIGPISVPAQDKGKDR